MARFCIAKMAPITTMLCLLVLMPMFGETKSDKKLKSRKKTKTESFTMDDIVTNQKLLSLFEFIGNTDFSEVPLTVKDKDVEPNANIVLSCLIDEIHRKKGDRIQWRKGNEVVESNKHLALSDDNGDLTIVQAQASDAGDYYCMGIVSKYRVTINNIAGEIEGTTDTGEDQTGLFKEEMRKALENLSTDPKIGTQWIEAMELCTGKCRAAINNKATEMEGAANGLDAISEVINGITQFSSLDMKVAKTTTLNAILKGISPFIGALGPLVSLYSMFEDSTEVQMLNNVIGVINNGFMHVDKRFDKIQTEISKIPRLMEKLYFWSTLRPTLNTLSLTKTFVTEYLKRTNITARIVSRDRLDKSMALDTLKAIHNLVDAFDGRAGFTYGSVCDVVVRFEEGNKSQLQAVLVFLLNTLIMGAEDYLTISYINKIGDRMWKQEELLEIIQNVGASIDTCVERLQGHDWKQYWVGTLDRTLATITSESASEIADTIYNTLQDDWNWRKWLVLVTADTNLEYYSPVPSLFQMRFRGNEMGSHKYILVSSVDRDQEMSRDPLKNIGKCGFINNQTMAFAKIPREAKNNFNIVGVARTSNDHNSVDFAVRPYKEDGYFHDKSCQRSSPDEKVRVTGSSTYRIFALG